MKTTMSIERNVSFGGANALIYKKRQAHEEIGYQSTGGLRLGPAITCAPAKSCLRNRAASAVQCEMPMTPSDGNASIGGFQNLPSIRKPLYHPPTEDPPSWDCSPISPSFKDTVEAARLAETQERKQALACAFLEFIRAETPPSQKTPASIVGTRSQRPPSPMALSDSPISLSPIETGRAGI